MQLQPIAITPLFLALNADSQSCVSHLLEPEKPNHHVQILMHTNKNWKTQYHKGPMDTGDADLANTDTLLCMSI